MFIESVEYVAEQRKDEAQVQASATVASIVVGTFTIPFIACFPGKKTNQNPEGYFPMR